jgi:hypothetical protein
MKTGGHVHSSLEALTVSTREEYLQSRL